MGDGSASNAKRLVLFAAVASVGTAILIVGFLSTVFLPGSVIPTAMMMAGAVLLGAGVVILFTDAWRQRAAWISASFPELVAQPLDRLRGHSRSEVADATVSGTLIIVFIIGFLGTGSFGFSNSAVGISPVQMRTDVAVSLISLAVGALWAWVAPISRLVGPGCRRTAEGESAVTTGAAMVGPSGVGGIAPSARPFWLLLGREAGNLAGLVVVTMVGGVFAFVAAYQLGIPTKNAAMFVVAAALLLLAVVVAGRIRTLRRLCATGVEVEAALEDVRPTGSGNSRTYVARYRYLFEGRSFPLRFGGIFRPWADRFGERPIILVDPEHPDVAVILKRSFDGSPSPASW